MADHTDETKSRELPLVLQQPYSQVKRARKLRKEMSLPAVLLWQQLQLRPGSFKFRREFPSKPYTLDFACLSARLGVEVDGFAHDCGDQPEFDMVRDQVMAERGFRILRLPAVEVLKHMESCIQGIVAACQERNPHPERGGGAKRRRGLPLLQHRDCGELDPSAPAGHLPVPGEDFGL